MIKATIVIIEKNGKIIFVKRTKHRRSLPSMWSLPADKIVRDEKWEETALRCAWHELGLRVKIEKLLDEYHYKDEKEDKLLYFVRVEILEGSAEIQHFDELDEMQWLSFDEFFEKYKDEEIGHGLRYLRKNPEIWR